MHSRFSVSYPVHDEIVGYLKEPPVGRLLRVRSYFGNCGYIISPRGAQRLLDACFPLRTVALELPPQRKTIVTRTLDGLISRALGHCVAYALVPPIVVTPKEQTTSETVTKKPPKRPGGRLPIGKII